MTVTVHRHGAAGPDDESYAERRTASAIEGIESLERSPRMIDALWNSVRLSVSARSAVDPDGSGIDTWEAVVNAMQVGSTLFRVTGSTEGTVESRIHHEIRQLPAVGPKQFANAPNWLDAFWFAIICRDQKRMTELCEVSVDTLRESGAVHDEYLYHWVAALQAYWTRRQGDMVAELTLAFQQSHPDTVRIAPRDWLQQISYPRSISSTSSSSMTTTGSTPLWPKRSNCTRRTGAKRSATSTSPACGPSVLWPSHASPTTVTSPSTWCRSTSLFSS